MLSLSEDQDEEEKETAEEKMILQTKDIKYIQLKLSTEKKVHLNTC